MHSNITYTEWQKIRFKRYFNRALEWSWLKTYTSCTDGTNENLKIYLPLISFTLTTSSNIILLMSLDNPNTSTLLEILLQKHSIQKFIFLLHVLGSCRALVLTRSEQISWNFFHKFGYQAGEIFVDAAVG